MSDEAIWHVVSHAILLVFVTIASALLVPELRDVVV
jgi:hypothetical protein